MSLYCAYASHIFFLSGGCHTFSGDDCGFSLVLKMLWFPYFTYKGVWILGMNLPFYQWQFLLSFNLKWTLCKVDIPDVLKGHLGWGKEKGRHPAKRETNIFFYIFFTELEN